MVTKVMQFNTIWIEIFSCYDNSSLPRAEGGCPTITYSNKNHQKFSSFFDLKLCRALFFSTFWITRQPLKRRGIRKMLIDLVFLSVCMISDKILQAQKINTRCYQIYFCTSFILYPKYSKFFLNFLNHRLFSITQTIVITTEIEKIIKSSIL